MDQTFVQSFCTLGSPAVQAGGTCCSFASLPLAIFQRLHEIWDCEGPGDSGWPPNPEVHQGPHSHPLFCHII